MCSSSLCFMPRSQMLWHRYIEKSCLVSRCDFCVVGFDIVKSSHLWKQKVIPMCFCMFFVPRGYVNVPSKVRSLSTWSEFRVVKCNDGLSTLKRSTVIFHLGWKEGLDAYMFQVLHGRYCMSCENFTFWSESQSYLEVWWMSTKTVSCFCWRVWKKPAVVP